MLSKEDIQKYFDYINLSNIERTLATSHLEALALLAEKEKEIERLKKKASPYCDGGGGEVGEAE